MDFYGASGQINQISRFHDVFLHYENIIRSMAYGEGVLARQPFYDELLGEKPLVANKE